MTDPLIDTDVLIRFLTGDDPEKQKKAADLYVEKIRGEKIAATQATSSKPHRTFNGMIIGPHCKEMIQLFLWDCGCRRGAHEPANNGQRSVESSKWGRATKEKSHKVRGSKQANLHRCPGGFS